MKSIAIVLGYPTKLSVQTILQTTQHTLVTGHGETKLVLTWKLPTGWFSQDWKEPCRLLGETNHQQCYPAVSSLSVRSPTLLPLETAGLLAFITSKFV